MIAKTIRLKPELEIPVICIKLMEEKYCEDFMKRGIIHFSDPKVWRDNSICTGMQLDEDEGCFCVNDKMLDRLFEQNNRKFIKIKKDNLYKYFSSNDLLVGTCFYSISKKDFKDTFTKYGRLNVPSKYFTVPYNYFKQFIISNSTEYKTIMIVDFWKFIDLLTKKIMSMGVKRDEIYMSKVYYVNKTTTYLIKDNHPFEYFLKDSRFSEQSEFRVIICTKNKDFYSKLKKHNNNIEIGDISSFAKMEDMYEDNLYFSIQGNQLLYSKANPIIKKFEDMSFKEIVNCLYQTLQNYLPGEPLTPDEIVKHTQVFVELLKEKYGVTFRHDWRLINVPYKDYLTLSKLYQGMCVSIRFETKEELEEFNKNNI